ncbi:photosensitized INA-labeled protein 1, PhIL1, putative [Plasmodium reichenowi]|uniref:Photosensitized INA-labeled protein 1, PhIL1, putative n=1 Tax=Plasmodium reichenowi TaxID=5854 RepID=A0A151LW50_PLARE|nr:photosensitized INA-labeled protein 1, PhIL1, putative [Plasmodium reichenowi]KYO03419.1 photosensitized INA-labeled protein 1, PhIL1, putative [Plasmodium reichenowi]SOV74940.1 photosensitized INA-labeled protein 1, PhIL1, putative [Plasmodium reichenowi]
MLSSISPKRYSFDKQGNIKEIDFLSCKSVILPEQHLNAKDNFICTTRILPNFYETPPDKAAKLKMTQENNIDKANMGTNVYIQRTSSLSNMNVLQYADEVHNNLQDSNVHEINEPLIFADVNQYCGDANTQGIDPGVVAVSNALFAYNSAFQSIPIKSSPNVFKRRSKGEANSEWSNAFVTRVDPYECTDPEEEFKPYEVTKYYDEGKVKTVFNFDQENYNQDM